ncbi:hypothetical protein MHYP_G00121130 [Metynnis hypsauchen]
MSQTSVSSLVVHQDQTGPIDGFRLQAPLLAAVREILCSIFRLYDNSVCVARATFVIKTPGQLDAEHASRMSTDALLFLANERRRERGCHRGDWLTCAEVTSEIQTESWKGNH